MRQTLRGVGTSRLQEIGGGDRRGWGGVVYGTKGETSAFCSFLCYKGRREALGARKEGWRVTLPIGERQEGVGEKQVWVARLGKQLRS